MIPACDRRSDRQNLSLPRDASAERGDATVSRPSVRLSVTFRYRDYIYTVSQKKTETLHSCPYLC